MEEGKLKEIVTPQRTFTNNGDDKFWMQLEFGMAKKYVDDLSQNVKRGNRMKLEQGWLPGVPPIGYLNDIAEKTIVPDDDRFPLVRKMWDLLLAGTSVPEIRETANEMWGFRTRKHKRSGGSPLALSALYKLFGNPFYYGLLVRNGDSYPGAHKPMISKDEFDRAQETLGRPNRAPQRKREFAFTGLIRCGECGAAITAEARTNRYGSQYTYYHCTKRRPGVRCRQKTIRVEEIERQMANILERVRIGDQFCEWALKHLQSVHKRETSARAAADRSLDDDRDIQAQLDRLVDIRVRGLLTDDEYGEKRKKLLGEQIRLKERLADTDTRHASWIQMAEEAFVFARDAKRHFEKGSIHTKREIIVALGSNFSLQDRELHVELKEPFEIIRQGRHAAIALDENTATFELAKKASGNNPNGRLSAAIELSQGYVDRVRTFCREHPKLIQFPLFCRRKWNRTQSRSAR